MSGKDAGAIIQPNGLRLIVPIGNDRIEVAIGVKIAQSYLLAVAGPKRRLHRVGTKHTRAVIHPHRLGRSSEVRNHGIKIAISIEIT